MSLGIFFTFFSQCFLGPRSTLHYTITSSTYSWRPNQTYHSNQLPWDSLLLPIKPEKIKTSKVYFSSSQNVNKSQSTFKSIWLINKEVTISIILLWHVKSFWNQAKSPAVELLLVTTNRIPFAGLRVIYR